MLDASLGKTSLTAVSMADEPKHDTIGPKMDAQPLGEAELILLPIR